MDQEKSRLQRLLEAGVFTVTGELGPPKSADPNFVRARARAMLGGVDAANVTDNQTAIVRMSSLAASCLALSEGVEPVLQMTCRDRNRIALQSDLLGAHALGIRNVLCLSGDHQSFGNHPKSKNVYDIDSIQLIGALKRLGEEGVFLEGDTTKVPPRFFLGGTANPFADPEELQLIRLHKKIRAGAKFIQTQAVYDVERFARWMELVRAQGLHEKAYILAGVLVNKSLRSIESTKSTAGMAIPDALIERMRGAQDQQEEGIRIALDIIEQIKTIPGVRGVHIMAVFWESIIPTVAQRAGFLPRPGVETGGGADA